MSSESWPPQLKWVCGKHLYDESASPTCREWVARCLGQMTDANRTEAQAELRQVIADAFAAHTLWTTDWEAVHLKRLFFWFACYHVVYSWFLRRSLAPKPALNFSNLKRKKWASSLSFPFVCEVLIFSQSIWEQSTSAKQESEESIKVGTTCTSFDRFTFFISSWLQWPTCTKSESWAISAGAWVGEDEKLEAGARQSTFE